MKKLIYLLGLITAVAFMTSCEDRSDLEGPSVSVTGTADFSRFVTIGNSITAGYQNGALYQTGQNYSIGNQIIGQLYNDDLSFEQPLYSDPGTGNRMELEALVPDPVIVYNTETGEALNLDYPAPYNNMGVPGAFVYDIVNATNSTNCYTGLFAETPNPMFDLVLRGLGSQFAQAKALQPTLVTLWIGNNDILGHATTGGVATPTPPTGYPGQDFETFYGQLADSISSLNCDVVVANVPSVKAIPFFTTVGPKTGLAIKPAFDAGLIAGIFFEANDGTVDPTNPITPDALFAKTHLMTLSGGPYAALLGDTLGTYYAASGDTIPDGYVMNAPFGFHPSNPWPNGLILDEAEIVTVDAITTGYNTIIAGQATARGFKLVDIYTFFNEVNENGYTEFGEHLTADYIAGGVFGLDGVHPGSKGYGVLANEFIKVINTEFNAEIPLINVSTIPGSIPVVE